MQKFSDTIFNFQERVSTPCIIRIHAIMTSFYVACKELMIALQCRCTVEPVCCGHLLTRYVLYYGGGCNADDLANDCLIDLKSATTSDLLSSTL